MKRRIVKIVVVAMAFSVFKNTDAQVALFKNISTMNEIPVKGNIKAPDFPAYAEWLNTDRSVSMADLRGKIVLLDFWTYCCINCIHVLPDLKKLEHEFPELVVIGIHSAKFEGEADTKNISEAIERYDIEHPVLNDFQYSLWEQYTIRAWPSFALIDPIGKVVGITSGEGVYERLKPTIEAMIAYWKNQNLLDETPFIWSKNDLENTSLLRFPAKIEKDTVRNRLFISDSNHDRILVVDTAGKIIDTIGSQTAGWKDGSFAEAEFYRPMGLAWDSENQWLYIADVENHLIRKADFTNRTVSTVAGNGMQVMGRMIEGNNENALNSPWDVAMYGNEVLIAMAGSHQLFLLDPINKSLKLFAGSGREDISDDINSRAMLAQPSGLAVSGADVYFADSEVSAIRMSDGKNVKTLIGKGLFDFGDQDGTAAQSLLQHPLGIEYFNGLIWIADTYNNKIKVFDPQSGLTKTIAGSGLSGADDGEALQASFNEPNDLLWMNGHLYIVDTNNHAIRIFNPDSGQVSTYELNVEKVLD